MTQLAFHFSPKEHFQAQEFFVSPSNEEAFHLISEWPHSWQSKQAMLVGPAASGKSHLMSIWAESAQAIPLTPSTITALTREAASAPQASAAYLDDADMWAGNSDLEQDLFHFINQWQMIGGWLLLSGKRSPHHWPVSLPDLQSRLLGMQGCILKEPDDVLLYQLLVKHAYDCGCHLKPSLVEYIAKQMPRRFTAAKQLIRELNHMSLQQKKPINLGMIKHALDALFTDA